MRNFLILLLLIILLSAKTYAREGMWMPQLLKELNESDMKSLGMQLNAEDIYSINHSSLKDAVVLFGGGCTGEIISDKGLLITNHHCGFAQIQSLSTIEKNYLKDGFWSQNYSEEIPAPGLTVNFINEIKDVSDIILKDVADTLSDEIRNFIIKYRSDSLEKTISGKQKASVKSFYYGLKFYMFTMTVFKDIRLVGTPPQSIGKFGGETDNWMWPRHTGDFSLWRIYCDTNNLPAAYSKSNIPFKPAKVLSINIKGVEENDFVMAMGFPGRTQEYILSPALEQIEKQTNPNRIAIREARLNVMRDEKALNDTVKLLFSSKFSTL
jgi:hypothetical protein